jgi:hypothetical protein
MVYTITFSSDIEHPDQKIPQFPNFLPPLFGPNISLPLVGLSPTIVGNAWLFDLPSLRTVFHVMPCLKTRPHPGQHRLFGHSWPNELSRPDAFLPPIRNVTFRVVIFNLSNRQTLTQIKDYFEKARTAILPRLS